MQECPGFIFPVALHPDVNQPPELAEAQRKYALEVAFDQEYGSQGFPKIDPATFSEFPADVVPPDAPFKAGQARLMPYGFMLYIRLLYIRFLTCDAPPCFQDVSHFRCRLCPGVRALVSSWLCLPPETLTAMLNDR